MCVCVCVCVCRLMQHMLQHSELVGGTSEDRKCCRFCYRQFSSPSQLQSHEEQVHGPAPSACLCRICEWAFENEPAFLNHMKSNHQPGEMPYLCQVCSHRSSFYADILQHFASFHRDSGFLMCLFCLKVTRNPVSYQQHLSRHQMNQAFHCNRCRLQFIFLKDKMQHKQENHRSFRRPAELEGLPPGSKVIATTPCQQVSPMSLTLTIAGETTVNSHRPTSGLFGTCRSSGGGGDHLVCLECGSRVLDFSAHYPTHVRCLLCPYSSCCSRAYASHMIHVYLLCCSQCDFSPQTADQMAKHLLRNPLHHSATCRPRGDVTVKEVEDNVDGAMAPVEDFDFSDNDVDDIEYDDVDDIKEELVEEVKPLTSRPSSMTTKGATASSVGKDDFLTARKLRVALSALCDGVRQASRVFLTEPGLIRSWLREAGRRQRSAAQERPRTDGDGAARMVAWVLSMREQQLPITESNFFRKASALKKKGVFSNAFRISYNWAVGFMLEHQLGVGSSPGAALPLPPSLEAKVGSFREFTQKVVRANGLTDSAVAAMDELCLFVDVRLVQDKSRRSEALELTGSLPLVTVYLAALADGTMLPSMILANRQMSEKVLPEFIHTGPEGLPVEEALDLWTNKIWLKHVYGPARPGKSMLVLDRHREHMGDPFLAIISGAGTLPAMIPAGCSSGLQPLEVCARPVLQRFLLARWETAAHQLQANVAQLLVDWLVEALTHLNQLPRLLQKSFCLSGLLREENEEEQTMSPEGIQADILKSLTEILLGPEASDDLPELLEDEEDAGEDQGDLQMAPEEEEGKEVNVEKDAIRGEEDKKETGEDREKEAEKLEEDSEEGGDETAEDRKEASKRRRETRIMVGEEVGDEWKITGKSRADGVEES
uniref:Pogo transposable element derived with ZNF domain b n=1 Tax=Gasterosteus aculeatus aculeatus TaxID=481459 RepID=A0AAQ4PZG0_GASAC